MTKVYITGTSYFNYVYKRQERSMDYIKPEARDTAH